MTTNQNQEERRDKIERFEVAFNQIHRKLRELSGNTKNDKFMELVRLAKEKHTSVRYNAEQLKQFAKLRNAIVHEKVRESYYIAEPHWEVVQEIEKINDLLQRPPSAMSIASKPVVKFNNRTSIKEILNAIALYSHSQFPIYEDGVFQGLLTEGGLVKWCSKEVVADLISIENITAADVLKLEKPHNVGFLAKDKTIYDVEEIFERYFDENKKIEAVLITHSGKRNEAPLGIITSWDLVQIDHSTVSLSSN